MFDQVILVNEVIGLLLQSKRLTFISLRVWRVASRIRVPHLENETGWILAEIRYHVVYNQESVAIFEARDIQGERVNQTLVVKLTTKVHALSFCS